MSGLEAEISTRQGNVVSFCGNRFPAASQIGLQTRLELDDVEDGVPTGWLTVRNATHSPMEVDRILRRSVLAMGLDHRGRIASTGVSSLEGTPPARLEPGETKRVRAYGGVLLCGRHDDARLTPGVHPFVVLLHAGTLVSHATVMSERADAYVRR